MNADDLDTLGNVLKLLGTALTTGSIAIWLAGEMSPALGTFTESKEIILGAGLLSLAIGWILVVIASNLGDP